MCFILSTGNGGFTFRGRGAMYFLFIFFVAKLYFKNGRKDLKINNHLTVFWRRFPIKDGTFNIERK
jgi:hypothetical protein